MLYWHDQRYRISIRRCATLTDSVKSRTSVKAPLGFKKDGFENDSRELLFEYLSLVTEAEFAIRQLSQIDELDDSAGGRRGSKMAISKTGSRADRIARSPSIIAPHGRSSIFQSGLDAGDSALFVCVKCF